MARYLLLHQAPGNTADLPREKMMEVIRSYSVWADMLRHVRTKDGKPVASDGPNADAQGRDRRLHPDRGHGQRGGRGDRARLSAPLACRQLGREIRPIDQMSVDQAKAAG